MGVLKQNKLNNSIISCIFLYLAVTLYWFTMNNPETYLHALRIPTKEDPLRVLSSACLLGALVGVDGTDNGTYPSALRLMQYETVKLIPFCPEDYAMGTPRETPDCSGGTGHDVLDGKAKVVTQTGKDVTAEMIEASLKMLEVAKTNAVELVFLMDVSGACGSTVIYKGTRFIDDPKYQMGMGICAAQLDRNGFTIVSQRDYASLEILYSKLDQKHLIDAEAINHNQTEWFINYFERKNNK